MFNHSKRKNVHKITHFKKHKFLQKMHMWSSSSFIDPPECGLIGSSVNPALAPSYLTRIQSNGLYFARNICLCVSTNHVSNYGNSEF